MRHLMVLAILIPLFALSGPCTFLATTDLEQAKTGFAKLKIAYLEYNGALEKRDESVSDAKFQTVKNIRKDLLEVSRKIGAKIYEKQAGKRITLNLMGAQGVEGVFKSFESDPHRLGSAKAGGDRIILSGAPTLTVETDVNATRTVSIFIIEWESLEALLN